MKRFLLLAIMGALCIGVSLAQGTTIYGKVVSATDGEPVIGASIMVEGTSIGTITDMDGEFSLSAERGANLVVSFIGMKTLTLPAAANMKIEMSEDTKQIDEVMVVAFGTTTKKSFTGSASVVKADEITKSQTSNVTNALAGKVAGVQGLSANGQPGETSKIRIRGIGSMYASNEPLYVIDGVAADADVVASLANMDIESVSVLKDAASNALYGARGANGVILITTKRGSTRDAKIEVDAKWGSNQRAIRPYQVMTDPAMYYETFYQALYNSRYQSGATAEDAHAYANAYLLDGTNGGLGYQVYTVPEGQRLIGINGKLNPNATLGYSDGANTYMPDNWYKELFNKGNLRQEYNLSVSGATDKFTYYMSGSYLNDQGIINNSGYERFTSRVSVDYQAKKWLKIGTNMSYAHANQKYPDEQTIANSSGNLFYITTQIAPIYPLYIRDTEGKVMIDHNGYTMYDYGDGVYSAGYRPFMSQASPASQIQLDQSLYKNDMFTGTWYATIELYKGLKITANLGVDYLGSRYQQTLNPFYGQYASMGGMAAVDQSRSIKVNQQYLVTYNNKFGAHAIDVLAGYEYYRDTYSYLSGSKVKLYSPTMAEVSNAILQPSTSSSTTSYAVQGALAQVKYNYDQRYYFSASYRADASSCFAPGHQWGHFWSVGAAWDMSSESWLDVDQIDLLKLKLSYGSQGNDQLGNWYPYATQYNMTEMDGTWAITIKSLGNEDLTWETSYNFNAGIDFSLFEERLSGTIEGFHRRTKDMLYYRPLPLSGPGASYPMNIGSVSNAGLDIELNGELYSSRNITWSVYANMTYFKNKILQLAPELEGQWIDGSMIYREGESMYNLYLRKYAGVDKTNGEALWYKDEKQEDGSVITTTTNVWANATQYETGDILPKVYGGFGTDLSVYGVDLGINFAYQAGGRILDYTYQDLMHPGTSYDAGKNWHMDILNAWTPENTDTDVPRLNSGDNYTNYTSDRWLISSNYVSLQNITLGYTLPTKWTKKAYIDRLRIYAAADNVALFAKRRGLDPRQSYTGSGADTYTPIRSISGGISITF